MAAQSLPKPIVVQSTRDNSACDFVFNNSGTLLATGNSKGSVVIRNATTFEETQQLGVVAAYSSEGKCPMAFSFDDSKFVTVKRGENHIVVFDSSNQNAATWPQTCSLRPSSHHVVDDIFVVAFRPNSNNDEIASAGEDNYCRVHSLSSKTMRLELDCEASVGSISFSTEGGKLFL